MKPYKIKTQKAIQKKKDRQDIEYRSNDDTNLERRTESPNGLKKPWDSRERKIERENIDRSKGRGLHREKERKENKGRTQQGKSYLIFLCFNKNK